MNTRAPVTLSAALAASIGFGSIGYAQPRPPPPGERPIVVEQRPLPPGERALPPGERPLPPGERPPPPVVGVPGPVYAERLRRMYDERLVRRAEQRRDLRAWEAARAARELENRRALAELWGSNFLNRPECRAELELHADRIARLHRIMDLAEEQHATALLEHARGVFNREIARNARVMADLRARLGIQ